MKISFKSDNNIELQVKQIMRENYPSLIDDVVAKCTDKLGKDFETSLKYELGKARNDVNKNDLLNILKTLKVTYEESGLTKESQAIHSQIKRLDVKA